MIETTELTVLEIKPEQAPALYVPNGLDAYLEKIRQLAAEVPDVTTKKGRDRIGSLARMVGSSKKAIEEPGRAYLKHLKEAVKPAEEELRRFTRECDTIRDKILAPRTEWDAEQERIKADEQMIAWHTEALEMNSAYDKAAAERFESDHEIALLLNDRFDRDAAEAKAEAERQRIAHEEELKRQAIEQARQEAEIAAQKEREAAAQREADLKAAAVLAERNRIEAQERAEREKQEAIADERRKAQQAEAARLAEEKRIADEAAKRAADIEHRKAVNNKALADFMAAGLSEECAKLAITAIAKGEISAIRITY